MGFANTFAPASLTDTTLVGVNNAQGVLVDAVQLVVVNTNSFTAAAPTNVAGTFNNAISSLYISQLTHKLLCGPGGAVITDLTGTTTLSLIECDSLEAALLIL